MTSSIAITCSRIQFPCPPSLLFLYLLSPLHPPISGFNPRSLARTPPEMSFRSLYLLCGHQCGSNANKKRSTHKKGEKLTNRKTFGASASPRLASAAAPAREPAPKPSRLGEPSVLPAVRFANTSEHLLQLVCTASSFHPALVQCMNLHRFGWPRDCSKDTAAPADRSPVVCRRRNTGFWPPCHRVGQRNLFEHRGKVFRRRNAVCVVSRLVRSSTPVGFASPLDASTVGQFRIFLTATMITDGWFYLRELDNFRHLS